MVQIRVVSALFRRADDLFFVPSDWRDERWGSWAGLPVGANLRVHEPGIGRRPHSCVVSEEVRGLPGRAQEAHSGGLVIGV